MVAYIRGNRAKNDSFRYVTATCQDHGERVAAAVCRHHIEAGGRAVGSVENSDDPNDLQA